VIVNSLIRKLQSKFADHFWSNADDASSLNSRLLQLSVSIYLLFFIPILVISLGRHFYLQIPWMESWSFFPNDPPGFVDIQPEMHAFGIHYFGDFLLPVSWSEYPNAFLIEFPVNYPPLAIEFIGAFPLLGYKYGLLAYLASMILTTVLSVLYSIRQRSITAIVSGLAILGLASGPLLASVDRGNIAGFSIGLLFLAGFFMLNNKWYWAALFIALATSFKLYAIVILIVFVTKRRWPEMFFGLLASVILIFVPIHLYEGSFVASVEGLIRGISGFSDSTDWQLYCWNSSLVGGFFQLTNIFDQYTLSELIFRNAQLVAILLSLPILIAMYKAKSYTWISFVLALLLMSAIVPVSYYYTLTWALSGLCVVFIRAHQLDLRNSVPDWKRESDCMQADRKERKLLVATTAYLSVLLIPIPIALPPVSAFSCTVSITPVVFFTATVFWLVYLLATMRKKAPEVV
jgi:hypothetical protein